MEHHLDRFPKSLRAERGLGECTVDECGGKLAHYLRDLSDAKNLTAYGTLYRALGRLTDMGLLEGRWEPQSAVQESRPVRRLYSLTTTGMAAAREVRTAPVSIAAGRRAAAEA